MFFKKRDKTKKRVVCPIPVILQIMQDAVDGDEGSAQFDILFDGKDHKVGFTSDFTRRLGLFEPQSYRDPKFYLNQQRFNTFEDFKAQALLNGKLFARMTDEVEVTDVDEGQRLVKFPWYVRFNDYIID